MTPEYTGCNPTSYEIYDETNNPHTILSLDQTNSNQIIVTCIDPSCVLNLVTYNFKVKACFN